MMTAAVGTPLPPVDGLVYVKGTPITDIGQSQGDRVLVLEFWATWCVFVRLFQLFVSVLVRPSQAKIADIRGLVRKTNQKVSTVSHVHSALERAAAKVP